MRTTVKLTSRLLAALLFAALALTACEQPLLTAEEETHDGVAVTEGNVTLRLARFEQTAFDTRAQTDITQLCARINVAVFDSDGTKVKTLAQKAGDDGFGTVGMTLATGSYQLVVIAHNCEGSATITSVEKVTFPNNKVTDTFYYYGDLTVSEEPVDLDLTLTRAVAKFQLVLSDEQIPENVTKIRFFYTGGSSTFSPLAGYGCVKSKQTEIRTVEPGVKSFDIYTMPHAEDGLLKLTVTAFDADENIVRMLDLDDVPVTRNQVTRYTGSFFGEAGGKPGDANFRMTADPEWDRVNDYTL